MSRLVVVSNRVGKPNADRAMSGGLAVGIAQSLAARGGIWFGWNGEQSDDATPALSTTRQGKITYVTQPLSTDDFDAYYLGYSNRVLWPLLHGRPDLAHEAPGYFTAYCAVNRRFARQLEAMLEPDDLIWVHDYHLIPLAHYLRELGVNNRIGFFLHTPFPGITMLRYAAQHELLLSHLVDYDLVGTQTEADAAALLAAVARVDGVQDLGDGRLRRSSRICSIEHLPIGIDVDNIERLRGDNNAAGDRQSILQQVGGRRYIMGADRLDYSKGIPERLRGYMHYLARYQPQQQTALLQIAQPTREGVPEYRHVNTETRLLVEEFESRFGSGEMGKLLFYKRGFPRDVVIGLLAHAAVGLVTPLRDGMNLVAKEFVAAQSPDNPGVLILGEGAGAAQELDAALLVDPTDPADVAAALHVALDMSVQERRERWQELRRAIGRNRITDWADTFLGMLDYEADWHRWADTARAGASLRRN